MRGQCTVYSLIKLLGTSIDKYPVVLCGSRLRKMYIAMDGSGIDGVYLNRDERAGLGPSCRQCGASVVH